MSSFSGPLTRIFNRPPGAVTHALRVSSYRGMGSAHGNTSVNRETFDLQRRGRRRAKCFAEPISLVPLPTLQDSWQDDFRQRTAGAKGTERALSSPAGRLGTHKARRNLLSRRALAMSGREDSNLRPPEPHSGALAKLRHAPIISSTGAGWDWPCRPRDALPILPTLPAVATAAPSPRTLISCS